jgi:hypothetical protein
MASSHFPSPENASSVVMQHTAALMQRPVPLSTFCGLQEHAVNNLGVITAASMSTNIGPHLLTDRFRDIPIARTMRGFPSRIIGPSANQQHEHRRIGCFDARDSGRINNARRTVFKRIAKSVPKDRRLVRNVTATGAGCATTPETYSASGDQMHALQHPTRRIVS